MIDPNLLFQQAGTACQRGDFAQAVTLYRQLLTQIPGHPQILSALGNAELGLGHGDEGVTLLRQSLAISEQQPDTWCNLARGLRLIKRYDDALAAADSALAMVPDLYEAWTCRGHILWDLGRLEAALSAYDRAAMLRPGDARTHYNRANLLHVLEHYDDAAAAFERALALAPDYADAWRRYAVLLSDAGQLEQALAKIDRGIALRPNDPAMHDARGSILQALLLWDEALQSYDRALDLAPNSAGIHSNRGITLHFAGRDDEAAVAFDRAVALDPSYADAVANRSTFLMDLGRLDEASSVCEAALALAPNHLAARWNKGFLALMHGDLASGLPAYELRLRYKDPLPGDLPTTQPLWRGEDIAGKTILIWPEQGLGDYLQFCRYLPRVVATGARVIVEVPERLRPLIATLNGGFELMGEEARQMPFDVHCPIMSLPMIFGTTLATIPAEVPYLWADPAKVAAFDAALGPGPRIGLSWSSNVKNFRGRPRNIPPQFLEPLLDLPCAFHVLQKDIPPLDEAWLAQFPHLMRHDADQNDFSDAAALFAAMDLIITVDTSVPHLAGALGKPVWLMLPYAADWRWLLDREDSPWYPSMRLFRQPSHGDWASVVRAVEASLADYLRR